MTSDGLNLLYETIQKNIYKCQVQISGAWKDCEIQKFEKTSNSIKVFIYLDENHVGTITKYRLIMTNGKIFDERSDNISKDDTRGLLTMFEYKIKEV